MTSLEILKFNLQERQFPYFNDSELNMLIENNDGNIQKASYQGCVMKAQADDGINIGPIKTESNREYWLTLAESFKSNIINGNSGSSPYITSMRRADGQ